MKSPAKYSPRRSSLAVHGQKLLAVEPNDCILTIDAFLVLVIARIRGVGTP
jgi:hypothetical protein